MSDIRSSFYEAINKANTQKPKPRPKKVRPVEKISLEEQVNLILNESYSALIDTSIVINNQPLIDWLWEKTKLDEKEQLRNQKIEKELKLINDLREVARKEWRNRMRMLEFTAFNPSAAAAAASSSAGAGGGRLVITVDPSTNTYVVDDYVDNYLV